METGGRDGQWRRAVETGGGDGWWRRAVETGGEMGSVTVEGKIDDRYQCQPHPGLQG